MMIFSKALSLMYLDVMCPMIIPKKMMGTAKPLYKTYAGVSAPVDDSNGI